MFGTISNASDVILDNPRGSRYNLIKVENSALKFIKFGQILVNIIFAKKKQMFWHFWSFLNTAKSLQIKVYMYIENLPEKPYNHPKVPQLLAQCTQQSFTTESLSKSHISLSNGFFIHFR